MGRTDPTARAVRLAFATTFVPGALLVVAGAVLWSRVERETLRDARIRAADRVSRAGRALDEQLANHEAALRRALEERPAGEASSWREEVGGRTLVHSRRPDAGQRFQLDTAEPTCQPFGASNSAVGLSLALLEQPFVRGEVPAREVLERLPALEKEAVLLPDRVDAALLTVRALDRIGEREEALARTRALRAALQVEAPFAAVRGTPLVLSLWIDELERLRVRAEHDASDREAWRTAAGELLRALERGSLALPAAQGAAWWDLAWETIRPALPERSPADPPPLPIDARRDAERALAELAVLAPGGFEQHVSTQPLGPEVRGAALSADGLTAVQSIERPNELAAIAVEQVDFVRTADAETADGASPDLARVELGGVLAGWSIEARVDTQLVEIALRPWRLALGGGIGLTLLLSGLGAFASARAVRKRLEYAQLRTELVTSISHELRTPLTAMLLSLEVAEDPRLPDPERREYVSRSRRAGERLERMVQRVLRFARSEAETEESKDGSETTGVATVLREVADEWRERLEPRRLEIEVGSVAMRARIAPDLLAQAVAGCLENALRYTPSHATVILRARREPGSVVVEVEDDGEGIGDEERAHLFEEFYRSPKHRGRVEGTGLGLALARRWIESAGGSVSARAARADGSGLVVEFRLAVVEAGDGVDRRGAEDTAIGREPNSP